MLQHLQNLFVKPLSNGTSQKRIEQLAQQVADQSVKFVSQLVAYSTSGMTLCETRGYIRARAGAEIRKQTRLLAPEATCNAETQAAIVAAATEQLVPQVLRQLIRGTAAASVPQPVAAPLRIAA